MEINFKDFLLEKAISDEDIKKIESLLTSGNISNILKDIKIRINKIIESLRKIEIKQIKIKPEIDSERSKIKTYIVEFDKDTNRELRKLIEFFDGDPNEDKEINGYNLTDKIFGNGYRTFFQHIQIDQSNFNKIDILYGLPNFLQNIGLGKKIYKKLIQEFNYISSDYESEPIPSIESRMVWKSIFKDKSLYSFDNGENLICFDIKMNPDKIVKILDQFYEYEKGEKIIDSDFKLLKIKKYQ